MDLNNKIFKLIENLNTDIITSISKIENRFDHLENRFEKVENEVKSLKKDVLRLENNLNSKVNILFDGYKQNIDFFERLNLEMKNISKTVDNHSVRMQFFDNLKRKSV